MSETVLGALTSEIGACRLCPRLVAWREASAAAPPRRFRGETYWARPVPGFGDPAARLLIVGLAPAAHGGNRTGRVFTGDSSGDFLFAALHRAGLANQAHSVSRDDGLALRDTYVAAAVRCAPPDNRPTPEEFARCRPFLVRERAALPYVKVVLALGALAWESALQALEAARPRPPSRRGPFRPPPDTSPLRLARGLRFGHGAEYRLPDGPLLLGSYHVSRQNTNTGRLTPDMLDAVLARVLEELRA